MKPTNVSSEAEVGAFEERRVAQMILNGKIG
jgi:hypothetical protein